MKKIIFAVIFCLFMYACSNVPITGRRQLLLVSDQEVLTLSLQQYNEYMSTAPLSKDKTNAAMVAKAGKKIADAVALYYEASGISSELNGYSWEFNLIADSQVNAFCLPGGKIVIYEGILPYTQNEAGLAVVIGHEAAHAIAKHANERMSNQMVAQYGTAAIGGLFSKASSTIKTISGTVLGLGTEYGVMLPFSRKQEYEADRLGLIFMAIAGYNPNQAVPFWERMSQKGASVPEFMSTHPSDANRIKEMTRIMPEAMEYYNAVMGIKSTTTAPAPSNVKSSNQWTF